jgi:hypothetical protein
VTSSPAGISCGADCTETYNHGTNVTLTASADAGWAFTGWGGDCAGTGTCALAMDAAKNVSATFVQRFTLTVSKTGTGAGTVTSSPAGISCGVDCTEQYNDGTSVTLTGTADGGSTFTGWSGCDSVNGTQCTVAMNADRAVTATFNLITHLLTVNKTGSGSGTVSSSPIGIDCGLDCTESYNEGTVVTLTATSVSGSVFTGWSGEGCSGTGSCIVTMNAAKTVTAQFTVGRTLTVTKSGTGGGTVTSSPAGITCDPDCSESYLDGQSVTLTANADGTSNFTAWTGCDSVTGNQCTVTMNANRTVNAQFTRIQYNLHVDRTGVSPGTVTSSPMGISCGSDCDEDYNSGTSVTLTATGGVFLTWSGCDSVNANECTITMNAARTVTANFV